MEKTILREEYISRINKVQDYIENNISEEFSLINLSKIGNFSCYHFHRIFSIITGETLFQYIQRIRLEKAASMLLANKKTSITEIALKCGFSNQSSFAKAFKNYFNMSSSKYRESNIGKVLDKALCYNNPVRNKQCIREQDIPYNVEVKTISDMQVIYIRHTGPYKKDVTLFERLNKKLYKWADEKNLIKPYETKWITLCHDDPEITDKSKLRISLAMTVEDDIEVDGEIGKLKISGGKYAIGHFKLGNDQYEEAWNTVFSDWMIGSCYMPDDGLCFELYPNNEIKDSNLKDVDIYIPIRLL